MKELKDDDYTITIEKLLNVVHTYTDPVRIMVVMRDAGLEFQEARRMKDFCLTERFSDRVIEEKEKDRLLKYYKDVPVWNLTVWVDGPEGTGKGRTFYAGIEARCSYRDIRDGWLKEQEDIREAKKQERLKRLRERRKHE